MEAKITAQKAKLDTQLAIQEAEQEAVRKEKVALLLKQEADEEKADNIMTEPRPQIKDEASPGKDTKFSMKKGEGVTGKSETQGRARRNEG